MTCPAPAPAGDLSDVAKSRRAPQKFTRPDGDSTRGKIAAQLRAAAQVGATMTDLHKAIGVDRTTLLYHLERMAANGQVLVARLGHNRIGVRYFDAGQARGHAEYLQVQTAQAAAKARQRPPASPARPPSPAKTTKAARVPPPQPARKDATQPRLDAREVIVPADVRITRAAPLRGRYHSTEPAPPVFSSPGIGRYLDNDSAVARAYPHPMRTAASTPRRRTTP